MTLDELQKKVEAYAAHGFYQDVVDAATMARQSTRLYIARTHPQTAFGGRKLSGDMFIRGHFGIQASVIDARIYANYFARWYNTGAKGRIILYGKRKGQRGPVYEARGSYFESNKAAIEDYYANEIIKYLEKHVEF